MGFRLTYPKDTWSDIIVVYNSTKKAQEITLPEGNWVVVANGDEVGTTPIKNYTNYVSGKAIVAPISMFVAYKSSTFPQGYTMVTGKDPVSLETTSTSLTPKVYGTGNVAVTFNVKVPAGTDDDVIYLAGSFGKAGLADWNPGDEDGAIELVRLQDGTYTVTVKLNAGETFEYKYTRGSWSTVEKGANKEEIENRKLTVKDEGSGKMTINDTVLNWADR